MIRGEHFKREPCLHILMLFHFNNNKEMYVLESHSSYGGGDLKFE